MYNETSSFSKVFETYNFIFKKSADPRVEDWVLFGHPFGFIAIISIYLYSVYFHLPNYMKYRKAYDIKRVIQLYNCFQIIACASLVYGVLSAGWTFQYSLEPIDYSPTPRNLKILNLCWYNFLLKLVDLLETGFFILRKKQSQVTKLHIYHHVSTLLFGWLIPKYIGGNVSTFTIVLNNSVHVIMYTYYLLSTLGPKVQQLILPVKSKLTMVQMVQFWMLAIQTILAMKNSRTLASKYIGYLFIGNLCVNFSMFLNFYMRSYKKIKSQ